MHARPMLFAATLVAVASALAIAQPAAAPPAPPSWDTIEQVIERDVGRGFSGSVLLIRDGEVFLEEGYGLADRERGRPNLPDTIYALGSTPIDFTHVAILQLLDAGKLDLDDPVSKFFDDIPADKRAITINHLRTGRSGLPDFQSIPGVDADPDHSPLSRDEFIQRFRDAKLLFKPGTDNEHSHFAWSLLGAVVEVASGQSYQTYIQNHVLNPAGMSRTGFFGQEFPGESVALGYGSRTSGRINSPPYWGDTSWLVMGSGGMVGTTGDLRKFHLAIDRGDLIPDMVMHHFPSRGVYANGDMYGFETVFNYGGDNLFYVNCNSCDMMSGYSIEHLAAQLEQLCTNRPPARFSIGIAFGLEGDTLVAAEVFPGTPAERAGLKAGDVLISANDTPFDIDDPLDAIRGGIEFGNTLLFTIKRGATTHELTVRPTPRE
ncbi:MAG: serine hydrolase [Planctomycetota bacterium]|nr:MAG: serine hydrolase [Planctomycetota bacterium]